MDSNPKINNYITKKRYSAMLIFCIFCAQFSCSTIIYNLKYITNGDLFWISFYHTAALFCALPQAGLSDSYGRKKHLIISLSCILLSTIIFLTNYTLTKTFSFDLSKISFLTVLPICLLLGVAGNTVPIARAGLADLKIHDFRIAMGWSTVFIGFGWVAPVLLGLIFFPIGISILSIIILLMAILVIKKYFLDPEDVTVNKNAKVLKIVKNSYRWLLSMFLVTGGASALFAYLFSEISFYQIYLLTAEGIFGTKTQVVGLIMAFGYAFGIIIQWIVYCSDKTGIKFGALFSLANLLALFFFKILTHNHSSTILLDFHYITEGTLNFLFAFGFGFLIPSLFSLMAKKVRPHHAGRLFGAIDVTDTFALNSSAFILFFKEKLNFNDTVEYTMLLSLFLIAFIFYKYFLSRFSSYEKSP